MRVYLAAAFDRQQEMKEKAKFFTSNKCDISSTWLTEEVFSASSISEYTAREYSTRDLQEVASSDLLVLFTENLYPSLWKRLVTFVKSLFGINPRVLTGGRFVEFGIAAALHKQILVIGPSENIFMQLPHVLRFNTWKEYTEDFYKWKQEK